MWLWFEPCLGKMLGKICCNERLISGRLIFWSVHKYNVTTFKAAYMLGNMSHPKVILWKCPLGMLLLGTNSFLNDSSLILTRQRTFSLYYINNDNHFSFWPILHCTVSMGSLGFDSVLTVFSHFNCRTLDQFLINIYLNPQHYLPQRSSDLNDF